MQPTHSRRVRAARQRHRTVLLGLLRLGLGSLLLALACDDSVAQGVRGPSAVPTGGTAVVEVASNASGVEVSIAGVPGAPTRYPVGASRRVAIPVGSLPAGTVLIVTAGTGRWRIEVVDG